MIDEEAREVYATFNDWGNDGDDKKIKPVLKKFGEYCEPRKNIPLERFKFNRRMQDPGETYDQYLKALRKLADSCNFDETRTCFQLILGPYLTAWCVSLQSFGSDNLQHR